MNFKILLPVFFLVVTGYTIQEFDILAVNEIKLEGIDEIESASVYGEVDNLLSEKKYYIFSLAEVKSTIESRIPGYEVKKISYTFPGRVAVTIDKRETKYIIEAANGVYEIDEEGFVLGSSSGSEVVDVVYDRVLGVGNLVNDSVLEAALIYSDINQTIQVTRNHITIKLDGGGKVILPVDKAVENVDSLSKTLQKILQKYTIENKKIDTIDLRFSEPVIKFGGNR